MRTNPRSNCTSQYEAGTVACRSAQGQVDSTGAEGLSAGVGLAVGLEDGSDWCGQNGQLSPAPLGTVFFSGAAVGPGAEAVSFGL
jgi:hypothetical protein